MALPKNDMDFLKNFENHFLEQMKAQGRYFSGDLSSLQISQFVLAQIPVDFAKKYHILPFSREAGELHIATDSDLTFKALPQIQQQVGRVKLFLADSENLRNALMKFYGISTYREDDGETVKIDDSMDSALKRALNDLILDAIRERASDIHLLPTSQGIDVKFRINGHLVDYTRKYDFLPQDGPIIANLVKQLDESNTADTGRTIMPDGGSFKKKYDSDVYFIRFATVPVGNNTGLQKINLRILPQGHKRILLSDIGYGQEDLAQLRKAVFSHSTGLFIYAGPTGAGKTTSLYAQLYDVEEMLGEPLITNTIDNPIEIREEHFVQVQVHEAKAEEANLSEEKIMKVDLRMDPDQFLYNEIRDKHDAQIALEASATGHRVFSTVHASNCAKTINRLLDLDVSLVTLLSELRMIVSQRLVAVLCPDCSKPHTLTEEEKAVLSEEDIAYLTGPDANLRERGDEDARNACDFEYCTHGFAGRHAIAEYIIFDDELRDIFYKRPGFAAVKKCLDDHNFVSMWEKGLEAVKNGEIELKELLRVVGKD